MFCRKPWDHWRRRISDEQSNNQQQPKYTEVFEPVLPEPTISTPKFEIICNTIDSVEKQVHISPHSVPGHYPDSRDGTDSLKTFPVC